MSDVVENKMSLGDVAKWVVVALIAVAIVLGNSMYASQPVFYRAVVILVAFAVGLFLASTTEHGRTVMQLLKDARVEVRKVVWPTGQETIQTTALVVVMILIMALLLWGFDSLLSVIVKWILE